jgi:hypothetical protein
VPFDLVMALASGDKHYLSSSAKGANPNAMSAASLFKTLRLPRMLRLIKIMRFLRVSKIMRSRPQIMWWLKFSKHANAFRLVGLVLQIWLIIHYAACAFYQVSQNKWYGLEECHFDDDDAQVSPAQQDSTGQELHKPCAQASERDKYVAAFYAAVLLIHGEHIRPKSDAEKLFATAGLLIGAIIVAVIFGSVATVVTNFTSDQNEYHQKMCDVHHSMDRLKVRV